MPSMTGAAIVVRALEDEGIRFAFGIPGTHNIELYDALAASARVRPVLVTDEQSASFMADAVWRAAGELACANLVPGAGLTHALSGIAEAYLDGIPMLVLSCGIRRDTGHAYQLHDIDQLALAQPVTKAQYLPLRGDELYATLREACAVARAGAPGPVIVEVPANLYLTKHDVSFATPAPASPVRPAPADLDAAAELLRRARRPLLYVGWGARGAGADLIRLAERLEAPVASTFQGKGVFPESHPLFLWPGFGRAAPPFAREVAASCDATLAIGCRFAEVATGSYGIDPPRPLVHVDIDEAAISRNYPADSALVGDAAAVVPALLERLGEGDARDSGLRHRLREGHAAVRRAWQAERSDRVSPPRLLEALQRHFGPDTIFTADSGNGLFLGVECLRLDAPGRFLAPVDYSCMGYAVPAAIAAQLARPDVPVVALAGDGALLMTGLELLTAASFELPVAVFVLRDRELAQIAQFQQVALNRKTASELGDYDAGTLAQALGVPALRLDRDEDIDTVLEQVLQVTRSGSPVLVDVAIDYTRRTYFTRGVVMTNLLRLPWSDRLRFLGRALWRRAGG
jgi:acetolactate synthase I/II/III large subunit